MQETLSTAQQQVLALMATGSTAIGAARSVGIHRNTVGNWLRSSAFRDALARARQEQAQAWRTQAAALASKALEVIEKLMSDPATPAELRLKTALAVRANLPQTMHKNAQPPQPKPAAQPGRNQPCPCGSVR